MFRESYKRATERPLDRSVEGISEVSAFFTEDAPRREFSNACLFDAGCTVLEALHLAFGGIVTFDDAAAAVALVVPGATCRFHLANPIGAVFRVYSGDANALRDEVSALDRAVRGG